jgi:four helix bundle protein
VFVKWNYGRFSILKDFLLRDQIPRAAVSVMNNIAEGFERGTRKDFARFLDQAKASAGEVRSMLYAAEDQNYLSADEAHEGRAQCLNLAKSIAALIKSLRKS